MYRLYCIILILLSAYKCSVHAVKEANSGPYRAIIANVTRCDKPSHPYIANPAIILSFQTFNNSGNIILNCEMSVLKDTKNVKYRQKIFIWEKGNYRLSHVMNDIGCNGILLQYITSALHIKYDREKCILLKGHYSIQNLDVNALQHMWSSKLEYGKMLWKAEVFNSKQGTFFCNEFYTVTEPV